MFPLLLVFPVFLWYPISFLSEKLPLASLSEQASYQRVFCLSFIWGDLSFAFLPERHSLCAASLLMRTCTRLNLWSAIKTSFCGCSRGFFCGVFSSLIIICLECEFGVRLHGVRFEVSWGSWTCRLPCFARFGKVLPLFLQICFLSHSFSSLSGIPMIQILVISQSSLTLFMFSCVFSLSFMSDNSVELFASSGTPSDILVLLLNPISDSYVSFFEIFSSDFHLLFLGASLSLLMISVFPLRKHYHGSHSDVLVWTLRLLTNGSTL